MTKDKGKCTSLFLRLFEPKNSEKKSEFRISDYLSDFLKYISRKKFGLIQARVGFQIPSPKNHNIVRTRCSYQTAGSY